jgi:hypothetical protein
VTNTIQAIDIRHAALGMPASVTGCTRVRVAELRLPVTPGVVPTAAADTCALVDTTGANHPSVTTDVVATGAFPETSAWGPPI